MEEGEGGGEEIGKLGGKSKELLKRERRRK